MNTISSKRAVHGSATVKPALDKDARALSSVKRSPPKPYVRYSPELERKLLSLMAEGMMLVEICEREDMPSAGAVMRWQAENPAFMMRMTRAREMLGDQFAWEVRRVADDSTADTAPADRIKMDAYRWLAAKHYPRIYGDKTVTELTGTVVHEQRHIIDVTQLSEDKLGTLEGLLIEAKALPSPTENGEG